MIEFGLFDLEAGAILSRFRVLADFFAEVERTEAHANFYALVVGNTGE